MKHILVIDDEADVVELLAELLSGRYQVYTATDGAAALELLNKVNGVDCIVLDLMMPTMSGEEFARRLRENDQGTPLVVASARHDAKRIASRLGADGCLIKPYTSQALIEKIEQATSGSSDGGAAPNEPHRLGAASRSASVEGAGGAGDSLPSPRRFSELGQELRVLRVGADRQQLAAGFETNGGVSDHDLLGRHAQRDDIDARARADAALSQRHAL